MPKKPISKKQPSDTDIKVIVSNSEVFRFVEPYLSVANKLKIGKKLYDNEVDLANAIIDTIKK